VEYGIQRGGHVHLPARESAWPVLQNGQGCQCVEYIEIVKPARPKMNQRLGRWVRSCGVDVLFHGNTKRGTELESATSVVVLGSLRLFAASLCDDLQLATLALPRRRRRENEVDNDRFCRGVITNPSHALNRSTMSSNFWSPLSSRGRRSAVVDTVATSPNDRR